MARYMIGRILRALLSVVIVTAVVMVLIYSCLDRNLIFANDPVFSKFKSNAQEVYKMQQWENYGYVDFVSYEEYLSELDLSQDQYEQAAAIGDRAGDANPEAARRIGDFGIRYGEEGYTIIRLPGKKKGNTESYLGRWPGHGPGPWWDGR